jgi:hypothetical protein
MITQPRVGKLGVEKIWLQSDLRTRYRKELTLKLCLILYFYEARVSAISFIYCLYYTIITRLLDQSLV